MARTGRRPNAFDLSFPGESEARGSDSDTLMERINTSTAESRSPSVASSGTSTSLGKRKASESDDYGNPKRRQLPKAQRYRKPAACKEVLETEELVLQGEEPEDDNDIFDEADDQKPIRIIDDFTIFDPKHGCELVMLDALERDDGVDRQFEAAGTVTAYFDNDEDEGQDVDEQEEIRVKPLFLRLSAILRFSINYTVETEPFYIETQYAWYILHSPSKAYHEHWQHFCMPHRISQLIISRALQRPKEDFPTFLRKFESKTLLGRTFVENDIRENILEIQDAIIEQSDSSKLMAVPFVKYILSRAPARPANSRPARVQQARAKAPLKLRLGRDIDLAVLKPENQSATRVTPRIAKLAAGYFRDEIMVVGSAPPPINKAALEAGKKKARHRLWGLIEKTRQKKMIDYNKINRVSVTYQYYTQVEIDRKLYKIGDIVLVPAEEHMPTKESQLSADAQIHDYFWFGRIMYFVIENQIAHVQWFNHGSQTFIGELAHPQELFLADHCDTVLLNDIVGKVNVHLYPSLLPPDMPNDYFCKFMHSLGVGAFTSIDCARLGMFSSLPPPDNCPVCPLLEARDNDTNPCEVKDEFGNPNGVIFGGTTYHYEDFILHRAEEGPAHIGYITGIDLQGEKQTVTARCVGRIADLKLPAGILKDERHLYLTDEKVTFEVTKLLKVIFVPCLESIQGPQHTLEDWLSLSYDHFYVKYIFPTLKVQDWNTKRRVGWEELHVCTPCCQEHLHRRKLLYQFLADQNRKPLQTLDLFGGVGAFSRGLANGSGSLKITNAIEISPSAAKTFARNSPETAVFNQCANEMLRYIIKSQQGHHVEVPKHKYDDKTPVPVPPKPGEVDVITAGFPCQSHSGLNMYKNAHDRKSNLILTTLSYMDYYSPRFGYFENVPGFLQYALNAEQVDIHRTRGGVQSGGLKLFVRALLDMNYQVRIGQLQAGHYGAPQRRVRFFIVAALQGQCLPDFPEPTHDFPESKTLQITVRVGDKLPHTLSPVRFANGIAQHPFVSIADSIFDLPRFDWKHPKPSRRLSNQRDRENRIPSFDCHSKDGRPYCGLQGQIGYLQPPQTRYQLAARSSSSPTTDIQQYTRRFVAKKVERVLNIPLLANADYTSLPTGLHEWQTIDPSSAMGKKKYNSGAYGRADKNSIFQTTVTNMEPTAKQSRVLHPRDHRMFTVRELARSQGFPDSFVFEALGNNVVTMHRQIGNAVPFPIGHALGRELRESLFQKWKSLRENATIIDSDLEEEAVDSETPVVQQHRRAELRGQGEGSDMDIYSD